jgi:hypothetical protein
MVTTKLATLLAAGLVFAAGCSSPWMRRGAPDASAPQVGMTKREIVARFGETNDRRVTDEGETWVYRIDQSGFVPWNRGYEPRTRRIHFNAEGRVTGWDFD